MANEAIYTRPSDQVADDATITIHTGTDPGDDNYGPDTLVDQNPAKLAKIDSTDGAWLWTYAAPQRIDIAAFIHGTFEQSCELRLQGHTSNVWTSPLFDAEIDVYEWLGAGVGRWPRNTWLDLTQHPDYSATGFQYWRLVCTGNSQNIQLGQVVFSPVKRLMDPDLQWSFVRTIRNRSIMNETAYGSKTIYARRTPQFLLQGDQRMTEAFYNDQLIHNHDASGTALPWLLIPKRPITPDLETVDEAEAFYVRWVEDDLTTTHVYVGAVDRKFMVEEVARGLRPGV
jgi:hypothetical protein